MSTHPSHQLGAFRKSVRERVATLVARAHREHMGPAKFLAAVNEMMGADGEPHSRGRRIFLEELRRAGASIRNPPDHRQLGLPFRVAS